MTADSDFPSEAMLRIQEVELVDSLEELKSSRSVSGKNFQNFVMLDAKIASALNKISLEEQKEDRFLRGRQIAFMVYDYFRVTGAHDTVLEFADSVIFTRWDEVSLFMSEILSDDILESLEN